MSEQSKVRLGAIDYADAASTAAGLALVDTAVEGNPIVGAFGDGAAPIAALAMKFGLKKAMVHYGSSACEADRTIGIGSAIGVCNNLAFIAGATGSAAPVIGLVCAIVYYNKKTCDEPATVVVEAAGRPQSGSDTVTSSQIPDGYYDHRYQGR